jgi:hypothetical protein
MRLKEFTMPFSSIAGRTAEARSPKINGRNRRKAEDGYEGETMSDQTHLLERIMGLQVELNHFGESSRQQQIHYDAELSRLRHENRNLQARHHALQAENNTLRVQLEASLSVISYLEQRLKFHLKTLLEQEPPLR